eukprot:TRINITY_DN2118_c1_g1_i1.p3 TRINITY_DN2118_c1_g1~~TRINITY_DN2118_c1_g1_i1.p3  ORF type:complete len:101 (-),score=10.47 TRINITY_DN2118_c1_g1_i1:135-437(-)
MGLSGSKVPLEAEAEERLRESGVYVQSSGKACIEPTFVEVDDLPDCFVVNMCLPPGVDPNAVRVTPVRRYGIPKGLDIKGMTTEVDGQNLIITIPRKPSK